jgi:hypothetical protein
MPRYFFHIRECESFILDHEGFELPGPEAARRKADQVMREAARLRIRAGRPTAGLRMEVLDDAGHVVHSVRVNEVLGRLGAATKAPSRVARDGIGEQ